MLAQSLTSTASNATSTSILRKVIKVQSKSHTQRSSFAGLCNASLNFFNLKHNRLLRRLLCLLSTLQHPIKQLNLALFASKQD